MENGHNISLSAYTSCKRYTHTESKFFKFKFI